MADWTFDGPNKLIIEPVGAGDTTFDVDQDIYSAWKRWVTEDVGSRFLNAFVVEGGTPIGATGLFTGTTFILSNGWKLRAAAHDHQVTIIGNIYSDDGIVSVSTAGFSTNIFISGTVGAQGVSTSGTLTSTQATQLLEIFKRLDLDATDPNTYQDDNSQIANSTFTLDKTDNLDGTFTVDRS